MANINGRSAGMRFLALSCAAGVLIGLLGGVCRKASAQPRVVRPEDYKRATVPQEPEHRAAPTKLPERKVEISDDKTVLLERLLGVRFIRSPEEVIKDGFQDGIDIKDIDLLDNAAFRKIIQPYLGKPVTMRSISLMVRDTIRYYRSKGRPVVDVFVPEQEITKGVVQLMVVEARVAKVKVEGLRWFSADLIRSSIRVQPGDVIHAGQLLEDIDYLNMNPFRFVRPVLQPGEAFGTTDVTLDSKDRFPMRFYAGYEDTGSPATGLERFFTGVNMGNVFGAGHEAGYQYTTGRHFSMEIHSAYWYIPLPNRDKLAFFGNIADYRTDHLGSKSDNVNWMVHGRYVAPLPSRHNLRHELEVGFDFRRADNDLQVGGATVYDDYIDVAQFAFQYGGRSKDRLGDTSYVFNLYWSPCANLITGHQNREKYGAVREGASPRYFYFHMSVERVWVLPANWSFFNRFTAQASTNRLPPTEQLGLGGYNRVRGYNELEVLSDQGLMATVELRTPEWPLGALDAANSLRHLLQFLVFFDYGHGRNNGTTAFERKTEDMLSVGVGLRYRINHNVKVRFDYAHKLEDVAASPSGDGRFHLFVIVSY